MGGLPTRRQSAARCGRQALRFVLIWRCSGNQFVMFDFGARDEQRGIAFQHRERRQILSVRRADVPTSATLAQKKRRLDHQETVFLSLRTAR
jgi:hypothetical protein